MAAPAFSKHVLSKYHYQPDQLTDLIRVSGELAPHLQNGAGWNHKIIEDKGSDGRIRAHSIAAMTLGCGPDILQERYISLGLLGEAYMTESICGELLMLAYGYYNRFVASDTRFHVALYRFPGDAGAPPLKEIPRIIEELEMPIACSDTFYMTPSKSVVFEAVLTEDKNVRCAGICRGCQNSGCPNRSAAEPALSLPPTYGCSRIFGTSGGFRPPAQRPR